MARLEQEIFNDLAATCQQAGFAHALAFQIFRNNIVSYKDELRGDDYAKMFSNERLIRTEISTLLGLMVQAPINFALPPPGKVDEMIRQSESLLEELHVSMIEPFEKIFEAAISNDSVNPFTSAQAMREPIFYGAESAYSFQYRDMAPVKYSRDEDWMQKHKGFTIKQAAIVVKAISNFQNKKIIETLRGLRKFPREKWSLLEGFIFSCGELANESGLSEKLVRDVIDGFSLSNSRNSTFSALNEFNDTNAYPILRIEEDKYALFQYVTLAEALYETPAFWMQADEKYKDIASKNRGLFAEGFAEERLTRVFGERRVYKNVDIWKSKQKIGETDVLVIFSDRAIAVQAKSKRLTISARKGNDLQLQADFKAAVQDACDQALKCSQLLITGDALFLDAARNEIKWSKLIKEVYPMCLVSDHFPALSFQARQFLKVKSIPRVREVLVGDVFFLDTCTEMLETPLRLLSYLDLRAQAGESLIHSNEHTALGFHIKQNLWMGNADLLYLTDDVAADLDVAMAARRGEVDGKHTPDGILTVLNGTTIGEMIRDIEQTENAAALEVGLHLLKMSGRALRDFGQTVDKLARLATVAGRKLDATANIEEGATGITVHCTAESHIPAVLALRNHCELRKYRQRARSWCGIVIEPSTAKFRFGIFLDQPWRFDPDSERRAAHLSPGLAPSELRRFVKSDVKPHRQPPGRIQLCPCGSGLKYKRCHGRD